MITFKCTKLESALIAKIAKRAAKLAKDDGISYKLQDCEMDLTACHLNGCPLDLAKLWESSNANFGQDVYGIRKFLNRENGKLECCFLPRCAKPDAKIKVGEIYKLVHGRFGKATVKVTALDEDDEWLTVMIVEGALNGINNYWGEGDTKTVRRSHCTFSPA